MELSSARLTLHPIDPAEARRIVDGSGRAEGAWHPDYPLADELDPLRMLAAAAEAPAVFGLYQIRSRASGLAIGGIGFFGPPDAEGCVEIGYGLIEAERGRGLATEALGLLLRVAGDTGASCAKADTEIGNRASQRVLEKAGFVEVRRFETLVYYRRALPPQRAAASEAEG